MGTKINDIPLLGAEDIECRVQSIKSQDSKVGVILLLYKNARVDMRLLDQVFGAGNWQRTHEVINGNLFCSIEVWDDDKKVWVKKQDVGVESNTEKEKGQASDAFKRAGFNWGIGRELYTAPFIYVALYEGEYYTDAKGSVRCSPGTRFSVKHITYNERREIQELQIMDQWGTIRYDAQNNTREQAPCVQGNQMSAPQHEPYQYKPKEQQKAEAQNPNICSGCGGMITAAEYKYSLDHFHRALCRTCQRSAAHGS